MKNASTSANSNTSICRSATTSQENISPDGRNTHYDDDDDFQLYFAHKKQLNHA